MLLFKFKQCIYKITIFSFLPCTGRVPEDDQILYQTERYHTSTFGYDIPVSEDGWYLLVLKFSEVYFNAPNMKVIMILNTNTKTYQNINILYKIFQKL